MRAISRSEAQEWCVAHRINLDERKLPQPAVCEQKTRKFEIPNDAGQRIVLLHELFSYVPAEQETLLWFTEWGVWPSGERLHMFERFRSSYGEHRELVDAPAYIFNSAEREDLISFAGFGILFLWDLHVLTAAADTWLFFSHDEMGWLCGGRSESYFA